MVNTIQLQVELRKLKQRNRYNVMLVTSAMMGIAPQQYKLEDPSTGVTFATLEKFAKAIGKKLEIKFV